ncbi:MAG TPA: hypothetical protein VND19_01585 [Acetobacteraceae bacterium]|nr:hypothetical protein [Acetobacteraceae bacterium]
MAEQLTGAEWLARSLAANGASHVFFIDALDRLIAEGRTGVMSGKGYFDWGDRSPEELFRARDRKLLALKQALRKIGPMEGT